MVMKFLRKIFIPDKAFYKLVLALALPIAMQSLITIGVNMLDTIMVGRLGEAELSAVSLANQFISIYHILCMGIGMGASVLVSRYWGMREVDKENAMPALKKTICIMVRITVSLALAFALVTILIPKYIMGMYTKESEIIMKGIVYFRYSIITFFFLGLVQVCTIVLRCVGAVRIPLFVSMGALVVNLIANYGLIFGKLGLPEMGIAGAALGTLIARIFEASLICGYLFFVDKKIGFRLKDLAMKTRDLLGEYVKICIPVLISDGILALGNNMVAMVIGRLGKSFVAANAITAVTQQMSSVMIQGVCQAGAIVTGRNLGEGNKKKAVKYAYGFLGFGLGLGIISALFITVISGPVIRSYQVSETTSVMAEQLMLAISLIIVFQSTNSIMTKGVLRGGGDTKMLMLTDNIFLWIISLPLGLLAGFVMKWNPFWIYICLKSDQIVKAVWCVARLRGGKWIKKIRTGNPA